uniref:Uncharacterized protein n=1 Tax=Zea mays TaxID=4577 RepID=B4FGE7_MAIZE|nr:unknown [Zea mays]
MSSLPSSLRRPKRNCVNLERAGTPPLLLSLHAM